jgi:SAM-dependent methyltransferase
VYDEAKDTLEHFKDVETAIELLCLAKWDKKRLPKRALDVGGGLGMHAGMLLPYAEQIICTDLRHYCAEYEGQFPKLLKEKFERHGHAFDLSKLELHFGNAMELPHRNGWFDLVTSFNAFEHIPDPRVALLEMIRVLAPGGFIYITFDPIWTADTGSHFWPMVKDPWAHLVLPEEAFKARMKDAGASEFELNEFSFAMNRRRLAFYEALFADPTVHDATTLKRLDRWEGFTDASHIGHENHELAMARGYSETELAARGMRVILQKK